MSECWGGKWRRRQGQRCVEGANRPPVFPLGEGLGNTIEEQLSQWNEEAPHHRHEQRIQTQQRRLSLRTRHREKHTQHTC